MAKSTPQEAWGTGGPPEAELITDIRAGEVRYKVRIDLVLPITLEQHDSLKCLLQGDEEALGKAEGILFEALDAYIKDNPGREPYRKITENFISVAIRPEYYQLTPREGGGKAGKKKGK